MRNIDGIRQHYVTPYRTKRETPRRAAGIDVFEDPAPPWVVALVTTILERVDMERSGIVASAIEWCERGDQPSRAEHLCTLIDLWPGAGIFDMLETFLRVAMKTGAGRRRGAVPKHVRTHFIPRSWAEADDYEKQQRAYAAIAKES